MPPIQITRFRRDSLQIEGSEIVATFDATVGDFKLTRASLRRSYIDGQHFLSLGNAGRSRGCVSLPVGTETRVALLQAALSAYRAT